MTNDSTDKAAGYPPQSSLPTQKVGPPKPATLGPYRIVRELGHGGMGRVYLAQETGSGREVALKVMAADLAGDTEARARFMREARLMAELNHPHIVKVFEVDEADDQPYIAMEYVKGGDLGEGLDPQDGGPRLPLKIVLSHIRDVSRALHFAHRHGVVHRDVKPGNILIGTDGVARLTDFGLARQEGRTQITRTGEIMGTPHYMSPEQWSGDKDAIGPASDQYSLGCVIYTAITGAPPFADADPRALANLIQHGEPTPPHKIRALAHEEPQIIALRALEKHPDQRYPSCAHLAEDLDAYLNGMPILARPPGGLRLLGRWMRRRAVPVTAALVAGLVAVSLTGWNLMTRRGEQDQQLVAGLNALAAQDPEKAGAHFRSVLARDEDNIAARNGLDQARELGTRQAKASANKRAHKLTARAGKKLAQAKSLRAAYQKSVSLSQEKMPVPFSAGPAVQPGELFKSLAEHAAGRKADSGLLVAGRLESEAIRDLLKALHWDRDHLPAHDYLATEYFRRYKHALHTSRGDKATRENAMLYRDLCRDHDISGRYTAFLSPAAGVKLSSSPGGAAVYLFELKEEGARLLPHPHLPKHLNIRRPPQERGDAGTRAQPLAFGPENFVGHTPLSLTHLKAGSYLFLLRGADGRTTRYPVLLRQDTLWRTLLNGVDRPIRLFATDQIENGYRHVPAGPFFQGTHNMKRPALQDYLTNCDDFLMSELEVTVAAYGKFLNDRAFHNKDGLDRAMKDAGGRLQRIPRLHSSPGGKLIGAMGSVLKSGDIALLPPKNHPVTGVSWLDAMAYVRWKNLRAGLTPDGIDVLDPRTWPYALPNTKEREKAVRGVDGRTFPTGNNTDPGIFKSAAIYVRGRWKDYAVEPVGTWYLDESIYGILDTTASVAEWLANARPKRYAKSGRRALYAPGSLRSMSLARHKCTAIQAADADCGYRDVGFRLIRSPLPR
ncbi:protein kinase [bacterium AH-315-F18]|nr:protein kinase [bacterium AH-315-F18]